LPFQKIDHKKNPGQEDLLCPEVNMMKTEVFWYVRLHQWYVVPDVSKDRSAFTFGVKHHNNTM
jgi:hypothetical protein